MGTRQPGRRPSRLTVDLVGATPEQIVDCLIDVDPAKAARVAYLIGGQLAHEEGPIGRVMAAADSDPVGFVADLIGRAVQAHGRPPGPGHQPGELLDWSYEPPEDGTAR